MAPKRKFAVQMYETEYRQIQAWVAKHQHIETGGDLFGLWADEHTAVVQLVLGPGKNCRRSAVSFYQDIDYLQRVGNVLTSREGLCHIGEWHSHHRIGLTRPSGGDENTVWTNMDRYGIHRFFLFIATIGSSKYDVNIGCFLFEINPNTKRQQPVLRGDIKPFAENVKSPFRNSVEQCLTYGAESLNTSQWLNRFNSNTFTGKRSFNFLEEDQNGKRPRKTDPEKEARRYTTQKESNDQNLTGETELKNQEDKRESTQVKDRGKPNMYEEEESQGNQYGCILFKEDNTDHEKQQPDLEEDPKKPENQESQAVRLTTGLSNDSDRENRYVKIQVSEDDNQDVEPEIDTTMDRTREKNNKSENLNNLSSVTAKETEDKDALSPKNAKKPKVEYLGYEEGSKGRQDALHDKVSGDVEATTVTNSQVIEVKPANEDSKPNQSQNSNTLDRNERTLKHSSKVYAVDELKDAQLNERKQQSIFCGEIEEMKSENEIQDEESDTEGEKSTSNFLCFPSSIERKAFKDKEKEKKTEKNEKQKEKKRKKEEKKKQKKEEKEKKKQKKEEKKEKKKQKKEEKKKQKKEEKEKKQKKEEKKEKKKQKKEQKKEEKEKKDTEPQKTLI